MSDSVAGFETGGFSATLSGYFDTTHHTSDADTFGNIILSLDGADVAKQRMGIRSVGAAAMTIMMPFHLEGTFNTEGVTPSIEVRAYSTLFDDETTASNNFFIREARLIIAGTS